MGIFGTKKTELTKEQSDKLNSYLPEHLKQSSWFSNQIKNLKGDDISLHDKVVAHLKQKVKNIESIKETIIKTKTEFEIKASSKIKLFNTEIYESVPLGLIDVGVVKRFGTASTGNRFENGVIGYAIEQTFDDVWAKGNAQEQSVSEVKQELKLKAFKLYPKCNMIFKYDIDFRELGSSGNVFIYLRGTACVGNNKEVLDTIEKGNEQIEIKKKGLVSLEEEANIIRTNLLQIPKTEKEIEIKLFTSS